MKKQKKQSKINTGMFAFICSVLALVCVVAAVLVGIKFGKPKYRDPSDTGNTTGGSSDGASGGSTDAAISQRTFTEYVGTISNPGVGYTTCDAYHAAPNNTLVHNSKGAVVLFFVDISQFSAGMNGTGSKTDGTYVEGTDYDLDATFFHALRQTFEICRQNGSTIALRFRYDENGWADPEPKTFQKVLDHINQIKQSGVLQDYADIIMFVESGFVGKYGEQHGGKYVDVEHKAQLLAAMLDCVPAPIPVTVRTPDIFAKYVGINRNQLADYVCRPGTDDYRVGLYNDGYMGSKSDLGTYANREIETTWLGNQTLTAYFGGEFSGNLSFAQSEGAYVPEKAIPEMYKTHLSYINGNIFNVYKEYTFSADYDVDGVDNSAYYGETVWQFIRDHIGYRFVLKSSALTADVLQGDTLDVTFNFVNNGFANPIKAQNCQIILEKDGKFLCCDVNSDPTTWYSGQSHTENLKIKLPSLEVGQWNVYFKSSIGNTDMSQFAYRSIRFANVDTWNESLGANFIGSFNVVANSDSEKLCDNTLYQEGETAKQAQMLSFDGIVNVDGKVTSGEWSETDVIGQSDSGKLYLKADEENLYLMSTIPHNSGAPVFNVHVKNTQTGKTFWLYQASNGFVYFDKDSEKGHVGMQMKYSDTAFEFKIPLYMFEIAEGTVLAQISVNVQDSSEGWVGKGSVAATNVTVERTFAVYSVCQNVCLKQGLLYTLQFATDAEVASVLWEKDGETLADSAPQLVLTASAESAGTYCATVTTAKGITRKIQVAVVQVV